MKRFFGNRLSVSMLAYVVMSFSGVPELQAGSPYSQTLIPGVQINRPGSVTLTFTGTPEPGTDGTLTVTGTGDINEPGESLEVTGEDGLPLGTLFDGPNGDPDMDNITETGTLTIPLAALTTWAADGTVAITFTIPTGNFAGFVRLDLVKLTYEGTGPRFSPQEKQVFRKMAILMATGGFSSALVGTFCAFIPEPIFTKACALIASGFATSASYGAFLANQAANDPPDPNFTVIDQPVIPSLPSLSVEPGVTQEMADAWSALSGNLTQVIGFWRALITAVERAQGAAEAGNVFWETLQLQAAAKFASQLATLHSTQPTLRTNMQSALQNAGFPSIPITASDLSQFQSDILANGLPSSLTNLLTQLGADSTTIEDIESLLVAQDPSDAAGSFPEILTNPLLNASFQEVAHALGEFSLSTPPPIPGDLDRDGIPDSEDVCPNSNLEATVITDGCDSGVTEHLDADGCIISDLIADCVDGARNHGQFVSCVAHLTNGLKKAGTITSKEKSAIQSCAAQANVP